MYLDAPEAGDGRVTRASAMLPGVRTWQLDCEHGDLPDEKDAFEAYLELLQTGSTNRLAMVSGTAPTRAGTAPSAAPIAHVRSRPSRLPSVVRPPETPRDVVALEGRELPGASAATGTPLSISVVNGDLTLRAPAARASATTARCASPAPSA